jgi:predicted Ser/Thr protein kinase
MGLAGGATRPFGILDFGYHEYYVINRPVVVRGTRRPRLAGRLPYGGADMSDEKQKEAARRNIERAREVQSERAHGADIPRSADGLSTAEKDRLADSVFAFPAERKEPLVDAAHVRNAIARFDQVEGVTDEERDQAWQRIRAAAGKYDVDISEGDWRDLFARSTKEKKQ